MDDVVNNDPKLFVEGFSLGIPPQNPRNNRPKETPVEEPLDDHNLSRVDRTSFRDADSSRLHTADLNTPSDDNEEQPPFNAGFRSTVRVPHYTATSTAPQTANDKQLKWLGKSVQHLSRELEEVRACGMVCYWI